MKKRSYLFLSILLLLVAETTFAQIKEIPISEKVDSAHVIIEGKVKNTYSFWNIRHTRIYTANVMEVYKVFKGDSISSMIEIITEGGQIDNQIQEASHSLTLTVGDVGIFMVDAIADSDSLKREVVISMFKVYGGVQGVVKYNTTNKTASDTFNKYQNIQTDLYNVISLQTGNKIRILNFYDMVPLNEATTTKKKCKWSKIFKCKSKKQKTN